MVQRPSFYAFRSKLRQATIQAHPGNVCGAHVTGQAAALERLISGLYDSINFPVLFQQVYGHERSDMLDTGWPGLYLISNRMREAFETDNLSGWKPFDIRLLDSSSRDIRGYHGLSIIGRCGKIDLSQSEIVYKKLGPHGRVCKYYKGLHPQLDKWDGTDFFLPRGSLGTIVTSRVADLVRKAKLTNVRLTELEQIELSEDTADLIRSKA